MAIRGGKEWNKEEMGVRRVQQQLEQNNQQSDSRHGSHVRRIEKGNELRIRFKISIPSGVKGRTDSLPGMSDDLSEGTSLQVLHHDPQLVPDQERVVHLHDVRVVIVSHDDDFVEQKLPSLLLPQIHLLDSHLPSGHLIGRDPDRTRRSLTDLREVGQVVPGISSAHHHLQCLSELLVGQPLLLRLLRRLDLLLWLW